MAPDASTENQSSPLSGLHLLLTYECNYECDHCFVWGGPSQSGTMTVETIGHILDEAEAMKWLQPIAALLDDFSISSDAYHGSDEGVNYPEIARRAAQQLGIPTDFISVAAPEAIDVEGAAGQLPAGESAVLYRGRAAQLLASRVDAKPWEQFTECPWEDLRTPERVHVDPFGHLHICQGISIGNLLERPLTDIMADYDPDKHPIVGPLLAGGPAEIVRRYGLPHEDGYADHCHLCYTARCALRERFPDVLTPDQMYGTS
jgi:hypothetical protein